METLQIVKPGRAEIIETTLPTPGPGQVLVEVEAVTTCPQWDVHIMAGEPMFPGKPIEYPYTPGQPGHEAVGVVVDVGAGVRELAPATRVAAWRDPGHDVPGSYAQYVVRDQDDLLPVPNGMPAEALAPLELAMCVQVSFESLERQDPVADQRIAISGLGAAGLVAIQLARAKGAREVIGFDLSPSRREFATKIGADRAFDPRDVHAPANRRDDSVVDIAIDCAGNATSVQFLMDRTRLAVALFGVLRDDVRFGWQHWSGLSLLGYRPHNRVAAQAALAHIVDGELDLRRLVTRTMPLSDYEQGLEMLRKQQAIKVCFIP